MAYCHFGLQSVAVNLDSFPTWPSLARDEVAGIGKIALVVVSGAVGRSICDSEAGEAQEEASAHLFLTERAHVRPGEVVARNVALFNATQRSGSRVGR